MKKLKKVKLINWHSFSNQTIEIEGNCLITGENGSGKSTFLDAIQYVLTAGKVKFNCAADETSKRTIETYIRGKLNYSSKEYLRPNDVTSYIVLEFYDEEKHKVDLLGAVLEITNTMPQPSRTFFKIADQSLEEKLFLNDKYLFTLAQFKRLNYVEDYDSTREFQKVIRAFLGFSSDKYFELLTKSLAFQPIKNVNEFVNTFLLNEDSISLESLQQNVEQFKKLDEIIVLEERKIKDLEVIDEKINGYINKKNELAKTEYFLQCLDIENIKNEIKNANAKIEENHRSISKYMQDKITLENQKSNLEKVIENYRRSLSNNEEYKLYDLWEEKQNKNRKEQQKLEIDVVNLKKWIKEESDVLKDFTWSKKLSELSKNDYNISFLEETLLECKKQIKKEKDELQKQIIFLEEQKEKKQKEINLLSQKLKALEKKQRPYVGEIVMLQAEIKKYFLETYHKNIEVRPLCEYLEITDETWRMAIEGYLNTQRFDLIIEPMYFDEALEIYEKQKKEKKIFGVGLVNTKKLEDIAVTENSLANYIKANYIYAERYAKYLLNKVICCEKVEDLKKFKQSITPTCMTYRNHVARQISPNAYKYYFIGEKAIEQQLTQYQNEYNECSEKYQQIIDSLLLNQKKLEHLKASKNDIIIDKMEKLREYQELENEFRENARRMSELEISGLLNNILEQKQKISHEVEELKSRIDEIQSNILDFKNKNNLLEETIKNNQEELSITNNNLLTHEEWKSEFTPIFKKYSFKELKEKWINDSKINEMDVQKYQILIESLQQKYNEDYQFDQIPSIENCHSYQEELYHKREFDLVQYKARSAEFKELCEKSFREDFISKLRDKINNAQNEIKNLNKSLTIHNFGKEHYEFVYEKSLDLEMANYYRIIMSGENYQINTLFEDNLNIKDKASLDELFAKITSSASLEKAKKAIEEYTDYRNYMSYDIKITNADGDSYFFSKVSKEKSGGEIQTPFYVIIASAFEQLLRSSKRKVSVGCIVMFDEAFNTMDESRIEAMMDFYNELNIQLLIAVPPEKTSIISPYVSTNLLIINRKNNAYITSFRLDENLT